MADVSDIFQIDQDFPTPNALLVPGPHPESFRIFIYRNTDWFLGRQDTSFALAQSDVNTDGTWKGVFDGITQTYSKVTLPETEDDGEPIEPFTVVAISSDITIVLGVKVVAPTPVPPGATVLILPTIEVDGDYTTLITDCVILVDVTAPTTITLTTTGLLAGQFYEVKAINPATGPITVQGQSGNIDTQPSLTFSDFGVSLTFSYDGTDFWVT